MQIYTRSKRVVLIFTWSLFPIGHRNSSNEQFYYLKLLLNQAYYRQGVALQCLAKHGEAIAAFANGLAQDPKSPQLLEGLVEATLKSPLKGKPELNYNYL